MIERVLRDVHDDEEIPGRPAGLAVLALPVQAQALAGRDAGRDLHGQPAFVLDPPLPVAFPARIRDDLALAAAVPAGPGDGQEPLLVAHLAPAPALRADLGGAAAGARAVAAGAHLEARYLEHRLGAGGRVGELDLQVVAEVCSAAGAPGPAPLAEAAESEDVAQVAQDVAEVGEDRRVEALRPARAVDAGMAELVVAAALAGVGQHRVGLGRLLEAFLGPGVARVPVGVILERQLAVGALDLLLVRGARDAQNLVVVSLAHAFATLTMAGRSRRPASR